MSKPKILWIGDLINKTGFSRVSHAILERLEQKYEIACLAINYWGDPTPYQQKWRIYPASAEAHSDVYGYSRIVRVCREERPSVVIALNDLQVNNMWAQQVEAVRKILGFKYIGYMPIDNFGVYRKFFGGLKAMDHIVTYTPFAADILRQSTEDFDEVGEIHVIPHGIDSDVFKPLPEGRSHWKKAISAQESDFIVFNGNRNQPRKRIDLTIKAFSKFAVGKPNARLYLHMGTKDAGWEIVTLFNREMRKQGLDPNGKLYLTSLEMEPEKNTVTTEKLNQIYNACDVGINTCQGGGWELVNFEHAATGAPQVVPYASCFPDIYGTNPLEYCYSEVQSWETDRDCGLERGVISLDSIVNQLNELYFKPEYYKACSERSLAVTRKPEYQWDVIASQFDDLIQRCLHDLEREAEQNPQGDAGV